MFQPSTKEKETSDEAPTEEEEKKETEKSETKLPEKKDIINKMFRLPSKINHVVTLSTDSSEVAVYDVLTMEAVRTLTGITQPRRVEVS